MYDYETNSQKATGQSNGPTARGVVDEEDVVIFVENPLTLSSQWVACDREHAVENIEEKR